MARYPGAAQRLIDISFLSGKPLTVVNRSNLHTQAGLGSLYNFFNRSGRASSHFWVSKTGLVEQYVDTSLRAEADLEGNDATISTETEGSLEPWTPEQLEAIIALQDWIFNTHGLPRKLCTNSFVGNESSRGLGWHRLGIDGNFPAAPSRYAGRTQLGGGMHYSLARGKLCPGDARIDQIFDVIAPRLFGGTPTPPPVVPVDKPVTPPAPAWPQIDEDGKWGGDTTGRQQDRSGTGHDRVISNQWRSQYNENIYSAEFNKSLIGSDLIRWAQRRLQALGLYGGKIDGLDGHDTNVGFQRYYGTPQDGIISPVSTVVKAMQHELNTKNTFLGL